MCIKATQILQRIICCDKIIKWLMNIVYICWKSEHLPASQTAASHLLVSLSNRRTLQIYFKIHFLSKLLNSTLFALALCAKFHQELLSCRPNPQVKIHTCTHSKFKAEKIAIFRPLHGAGVSVTVAGFKWKCDLPNKTAMDNAWVGDIGCRNMTIISLHCLRLTC